MQEVAIPAIRSVADADVRGKRVLVRVDFNVPLANGRVADDTRIKAALPTLEHLHEHGAAAIVLLAHLGRPEGKVVESLRVAPVEARVRELTQVPFEMHENLRFDAREEANDESLAKELASQGDLYVNEAFADSHRAHASIVGVPKFLPSYAGLHFVEEVSKLSEAQTPPQGALAIIGGAKFETKEPVIRALLGRYSEVLVGGALGDDLVKARGLPFGASLISKTPVPTDLAEDERVLMPQDAVFEERGGEAERTGLVVDIRATESIVDIGPRTAEAWSKKIATAPFVLWNGPVGVYENGFSRGTDALAATLAASRARAVVGGGDTDAAVSKVSFDPERVFISTGGGAMLEFLANGTLPGIEALKVSPQGEKNYQG